MGGDSTSGDKSISDNDTILNISGQPFINQALITAHLLKQLIQYNIYPVNKEGHQLDYINLTTNSHFTLLNYCEAISCANTEDCKRAMDKEIQNLC